jgi:hypothetical protein
VDRERDGLPYAWEQRQGLDPDEPGDVWSDRNGTPDFEEFLEAAARSTQP